MSLKVAESHMHVIEMLLQHTKQPDGLREELVETEGLIEHYQEYNRMVLASKDLHYMPCIYCGVSVLVPYGVSAVKCPECEAVYAEYTKLRHLTRVLDQDSCDELAKLIKGYINRNYMGYRTPRLDAAIGPLQRRIVELGGERYKFY